ncbi:hypothetical protein MKEN_00204500 [Mycena kentingensis (nom. inval.)]|nr:hypothetical protein MKEN_00204500 [Mycena kentingensis (nom. inval.)]
MVHALKTLIILLAFFARTRAAHGSPSGLATALRRSHKGISTRQGKQSTQTSRQLDESVICTSFADSGNNPPTAGQSPSATSNNNFINICAETLPNVPLTDGKQIPTGSCNPTPMGLIPSVDNMPSAKFNFPRNGEVINADVPFNASLNIRNLEIGVFTNAQTKYFAAPQQLNARGKIIGHTHIVMEALPALDTIVPLDARKPFFFKGVNGPAENGEAVAFVAGGVPKGFYRMCSINTSANHAPVVVGVAQHGALDDCVYFTAR